MQKLEMNFLLSLLKGKEMLHLGFSPESSVIKSDLAGLLA